MGLQRVVVVVSFKESAMATSDPGEVARLDGEQC